MKKPLFSTSTLIFALTFLLSGCAIFTPLQKSQLIPVFHLIQSARYNEAKGAVDELVGSENSAKWARTWYARGLLSQTAYREGISKNDKKLFELYPDQLYVAFESFERADSLDKSGRLDKKMRPRYVLLANDFQKTGERHFNNKEYSEALRAFEHALGIIQRPQFDLKTDTNLVYNTALAAYEARKWDKAAQYLKRLHEYDYSPNVAHLLYNASLAKGDTLSGKNVLREGIEKYEDNETLVLLLADLHLLREEYASAVLVLDQAILRDSANFVYHNTKGMIYQRIEDFENAITAYKDAIELAPDEHMIYLNLATCYYNIGVDIEESTRTMTNISLVLRERQKSSAAFEQAVQWLDKVYEKEPDDQEVLRRLHELYRMLRIYDKVLSLEQKIR